MDKIKKIGLVLALVNIFGSCLGAYAQVDNIIATPNSTNDAIIISGDMGDIAGLLTTVSVFKAGTTLSASNLPVMFGTTFSNTDGTVNCTIGIPDNLPTDKYTVLVANEEDFGSVDFSYSNPDEVEDVMELMNDADTVEQISDVIDENSLALMIDEESISDFDTFLSKVSTIFKALRSADDYTDTSVFISDFKQCEAMANLLMGEDVKNTLDKVSSYTGFSFDSLNEYPDVQTKLIQELQSIDYNKGLLKQQIPQLRVLSFFKSSETAGKVKLNVLGIKEDGSKFIDNFDVLDANLEYYNKVKDVNSVFDKLFSYKSKISTFANLKTYFELSAKEVYDSENKKTPGQGADSVDRDNNYTNIIGGNLPIINTTTEGFNDIANHWAKDSIMELYKSNIISGYPDGNFYPARNITRAEFTKILVSVAGYSDVFTGNAGFNDVPQNSWYHNYVAFAKANGIINGVSETHFNPDAPITRQDACVAVYRIIKDKLNGVSAKEFLDNAKIADYAKDAVSGLSSVGIVNGYEDGSFAPTNKITRAEATVILKRLIDFIS